MFRLVSRNFRLKMVDCISKDDDRDPGYQISPGRRLANSQALLYCHYTSQDCTLLRRQLLLQRLFEAAAEDNVCSSFKLNW